MDEPISAADANRRFSQLLRGVREDHTTYIVTSHGKPVAKLMPVDEGSNVKRRALELLLARLRSQPALNAGRWTRDALPSGECRTVPARQPAVTSTVFPSGSSTIAM